jgi:hypothetical protein
MIVKSYFRLFLTVFDHKSYRANDPKAIVSLMRTRSPLSHDDPKKNRSGIARERFVLFSLHADMQSPSR